MQGQKRTDVLRCPIAAQLEIGPSLHSWLIQVTKNFKETRYSSGLERDEFSEIHSALQTTCDAYSGDTDL